MDHLYETTSGLSYEFGSGPARKKGGKKLKIILAFVLVVILIIIGLGVLGAQAKKREASTSTLPSPLPSAIPTEEPTPTPNEDITPAPSSKPSPTPSEKTTPSPSNSAATLNRNDLSIEIQNGSGIKGAAGQVATILRDLDYKILSTGNADNFEYEETIIQVKPSKKDFLNLLKEDLSEDYVIESATADLEDSTADALVIVGKR